MVNRQSFQSKKQQTLASLSTSIPNLFNDAQQKNAVLTKQAVALRKIQETCCLNHPFVIGQPLDLDEQGEAAFNQEFLRNVNKILLRRRREAHADNIVRFIATFLNYTQKQDDPASDRNKKNQAPPDDGHTDDQPSQDPSSTNEDQDDINHERQPSPAEPIPSQDDDPMDEDMPETMSSRFVRVLMTYILKGHTAKSQTVRLRCCQIIALSVSCLGELDEDLYQQLKMVLFERVRDKEPSVRIQAANALSKLEISDEEPDPFDQMNISQKLIHLLRTDSSAEVRRVVILNLELNPTTLPHLIERARDTDALNRRLVFSHALHEHLDDFRTIPVPDLYRLIKWGLNDRDPSVREAATRMITGPWINQAGNNLLEFLERMDVMDMVNMETSEKMLTTLLEKRKDSLSLKFEDEFWQNLTPESVFLARFYIKVLIENEMDDKLEVVLPELTRLAFYIQHYNQLWQQASHDSEAHYEFIVGQLFEIGKNLDYADEVGRRKMYETLKTLALIPDIPEEYLEHIADLLSLVAMDEPDYTRMIVDIIGDIQDAVEPDDTDFDGRNKRLRFDDDVVIKVEEGDEPDAAALSIMYGRLKCLTLCKFMLQRCELSLNNNTSIYGILNDMVIPAVQNSEALLREEGLHCLGLACHLDKSVGIHNVPMFIKCVQSGHDELKNKALMTLFDLISKYGYHAIAEKSPDVRSVFEYCLDHDNEKLQATTTEGLAKVMLSRQLKDDEMLKLLTVLYFFPTTMENGSVQQCLTYFFPAYCHSNAENQQSMARIAVSAIQELVDTYLDLQEDEKMIDPKRISEMMADWTDPRQLVVPEQQETNKGVQGPMALEVVQVLVTCNKNDDGK
ncbi:hypothetical protein DM01DRAFT_1331258 [Hesseltinella vesiculosa]|uniref:Nuclear condensin complex subunit 3 C-terminal domain-containing protein n=1 Tax=Hesseltinella vesiculosa TaxID=101127 RepID=A0A1X2GYT4_9FUNG|nr:hypothetical protein DM01DRAFT_1331258 [Hesseltinella vesiculosa]